MKHEMDQSAHELWVRYQVAKHAKSRWTAEEKDLKAQLLAELGYDMTDEKPPSMDVVSRVTGHLVGSVTVGNRRGIDMKYFRESFPDVYAECERWTHPISIKDAE